MRRPATLLCLVLLLGACGGDDKEATTTTTMERTTTTVEPTPEARLAVIFTGTTGYDLVALPPDVEAEARRRFESDPDLQAAVTAVALRGAARADEHHATIQLMAVDRRYSSAVGFMKGILEDMKAAAATPPEDVSISGKDAVYFESKDSTKIVVWVGRHVVVVVSGLDRSKVEAVATAVLDAA